jgi:hypothetical protein
MSMRDYPCSGYVIPLGSLEKVLPEEKKAEFKTLLEGIEEGERDTNEVVEFVVKNSLKDIPSFDVFLIGDEDNPGDDLETGLYYACFPEDDLYIRVEKREYTNMKKLGIELQFSNWSHYC